MFKITQKFIGMLLVSLLLSVIIGNYLDQLFNTKALITILMLIYSLFGSFYILFKELKDYDKRNKKD